MWKRIFFVIGILIVGINTGFEPTLSDLTDVKCPSKNPYICLPYGRCCAAHEFCHSGTCETCFPVDVKEEDRLSWCIKYGQHDVKLMQHDSCSLACQAKFNSSVLSGEPPCPDDRPNYRPPGICCRDDEFGQDGRCVSCFPDDVGENDLLSWCQTVGRTNTTRMPHNTCKFACNARFEASQLLVINDAVDGWMVAFIVAAILCGGLLAVICLQDTFSNKTKKEKNKPEVATNDNMTPPIDRRMQRSLSHEERSRSLISLREISINEN